MEFRILGRLEVLDGARELTPQRPKQRALLALLLLRAGELVTADEAAEALWDREPPPAARNAIQGHVATLRKLLGRERIETREGAYALRLEEGELDLHRFERLLTDARGRPPEEQAALLTTALALFRGEALEDFRFDSFAAAEAARIEELRLLALESLFDAELARGRHEHAVPELEGLVRKAPLRERLWAQLVLALYRSGRQADALATYRRARDILVEELGLEPGPELRRLERAILTQDPELDLVAPGAGAQLPTPATPFLGRERELTELRELILDGRRRLVTLTGSGGVGKTRLALEVARRAAASFPGGAAFVELAPLSDPDLVVPTLAHAVGARESGASAEEAVAARIGGRETLVVVDNVEHLAAAVPALGRLLAAAAGLTLLATSRQPLRLYGEHLYRVPPLEDDTAAALFGERAEAVGWRGAGVEAVPEICRRLDHLPLAIELAAARMDDLSPAALLDRLAEPLDALAHGPVDHHERQQTLRRTLAWSYERLDEPEQRLFRRLAAFAGGWTPDAADAVCGDGLDAVPTLSSLLDRSLLQVGGGPETRQSMLETVREYARELLSASGEERERRRRHLDHFLELAEAAEAHLRGDPGEWLDRLELEHPNLRAALDAAPAAQAVRLAGALWRFWYLRGHLSEGRRRLEHVLEDAPDGAPRAKALIGASVMAANTGDAAAAHGRAGEARALCVRLGDRWGEAYASFMLGNVTSDAAAARRDYEAAIVSFRALGDEHSALLASRHLAMLLAETGDKEGARSLHEDNLGRARAVSNGRIEASSLGALAVAELDAGRAERAAELLRQSLTLHRDLGDVLDTAVDLCRFAAATATDDPERAAILLGAFEGLGDTAAGRRTWVAPLNEATLAAARHRLGEDGLEVALARGRSLTLDDAVELALVR